MKKSSVFASPKLAREIAKASGTSPKTVTVRRVVGSKSVAGFLRDVSEARKSVRKAKVVFR